jgi:hypothetical protein
MKIVLRLAAAWCLLAGHVGQLSADEKADVKSREVAATVLGEEITLDQITPADSSINRQELSEEDYQKRLLEYRATVLLSRVSGRVMKDYAAREKLRPSDKELEAMFRDFSQKHLPNTKLDDESRKKFAVRMFWLMGSSHDWRTAKALYEKYGGRVAVSSFGACISIEGRNAVLQDYAARGDLTIHRAELTQAFWGKTKDERVLDTTLQPKSVKRFFAVPPWEREFKALAQEEQQASPAQSKSKPTATKSK